jgi:putative transposase
MSERTQVCPKCGLVLGRDHNSAVTILSRGPALLAQTTVGHHGKSRLGREEPLQATGNHDPQARSLNQESRVLWLWECQTESTSMAEPLMEDGHGARRSDGESRADGRPT